MPGRGIRIGPGGMRAAGVCLLVALAVAGLAARGPLTSSVPAGVLAEGGAVLFGFVVLAEVFGALGFATLIVGVLRARNLPDGEDREPQREPRPPLPWWVRPAVLLFALAMLAAPVSLLLSRPRRHPNPASATSTAGQRPLGPLNAPHAVAAVPWLLVAVTGAVALTAWALWLHRRRRHARAFAILDDDAAPPPAPLLPDLLDTGVQVLTQEADPRAAIVGCYAAMERSLADAGSPPAAADTPTEVLARAAGHGLVRSAAAGTLTGLFRRARYSIHPIVESDRTAALAALARLREELGHEVTGVRRTTGAGGAPAGGGT